nr:hypothetical protein [Tanacetum cinerariifolium]
MQTRSSSRLVSNPSSNPTPSTNPIPKGRNHRRSKQRFEEFNFEELSPPIVTMADQRTMAQLLQSPTEGYEDAIVIPAIIADKFELKHGLLTLVQNNEAWDRFKDLLRARPHHGFSELHQLDIFYNALNSKDQDSLNSAVGGNFLDKMPRECLAIIESKSKVCYSRNKPVVTKLCAFTSSSGTLPSNTIANLRSDLKAITTQSGVSYDGPQIPPPPSFLPKVMENEPEATKDTVTPPNNGSTEEVQPPVVSTESLILNSEPINSPIIEPVASPVNALILMPKFASTLKALIGNKEKLSEMARTPLNEHCFAALLKKLPEKLGDPRKFLIHCNFLRMGECLALANLDTSINLMPLSVWKRLSLPELSLTYFDADPRVSLILGRSFLKTRRVLIDVFEANYNDMMAKRIDVIDMACKEYSQEVLGISDVIVSGNPTPYYDSIVSTTSPTLTPFGNNDFLLKEVDAFLALEDDPTSPEVDQTYVDSEGDILLLEAFLNDDPSLPPPNQGTYLPEVRKELKIREAKSDKSSIDEPPEVELKDLPPHLKYAFLEGDDKLLVIIAKDFSVVEKTALITVMKLHKGAITWKLSNIKGINLEFCTHKILMKDDFEPPVQHQ